MVHNLVIGKYTLESLTSGMYLTPLDLFREYVQNSADAIDTAIKEGVLSKGYSDIRIIVKTTDKYISVEDNGIGIKESVAAKTLIDIGNSQKDHASSRGFRGIGRLAGLGYCDNLVFTCSYAGESVKTIVTIDAKSLKSLKFRATANFQLHHKTSKPYYL